MTSGSNPSSLSPFRLLCLFLSLSPSGLLSPDSLFRLCPLSASSGGGKKKKKRAAGGDAEHAKGARLAKKKKKKKAIEESSSYSEEEEGLFGEGAEVKESAVAKKGQRDRGRRVRPPVSQRRVFAKPPQSQKHQTS